MVWKMVGTEAQVDKVKSVWSLMTVDYMRTKEMAKGDMFEINFGYRIDKNELWIECRRIRKD